MLRFARKNAPRLTRLLCAAPVLVTLMLAGCAARSVPKDFRADTAGNEGVVLVSVSHDASLGRRARALFFLDGGPKEGGGLVTSLQDAFPGIPGGSDLEDGYGKIYALPLPAGRHRISSWLIVNGPITVRPGEVVPLEFDVVPGEIKYLGNLHASLRETTDLFGRTIVADGHPDVRDARQRDLPLFEERYPQWHDKIAIGLLQLGPWSADAKHRRDVYPPVLVPLVPVRK